MEVVANHGRVECLLAALDCAGCAGNGNPAEPHKGFPVSGAKIRLKCLLLSQLSGRLSPARVRMFLSLDDKNWKVRPAGCGSSGPIRAGATAPAKSRRTPTRHTGATARID
jgi:hypothetical protein